MKTDAMAGKSWQPSHGRHAVRGTGTRHTAETVERGRERGGRGGRGTAWTMCSHTTKMPGNACYSTFATLRSIYTWNSKTCVDTAYHQGNASALSIKLHFTA